MKYLLTLGTKCSLAKFHIRSEASIFGILIADGTFKEFSFLGGLIFFPIVHFENDGNTHPI
jgi:hypothetical protein